MHFMGVIAGKRDLQFEKVISDVTADMKLTRDDDFTLRVVQLSELLAIRHCVFLMGPTGSGRSEVYKVGGQQPWAVADASHVLTHNDQPADLYQFLLIMGGDLLLQYTHGTRVLYAAAGCRFWHRPLPEVVMPQWTII